MYWKGKRTLIAFLDNCRLFTVDIAQKLKKWYFLKGKLQSSIYNHIDELFTVTSISIVALSVIL